MTDQNVLKKKLSTYRSAKDQLRGVPAEVLNEVLKAWEQWSGTSKDFYSSIGVSQKQMAGLIGKAKRMKREGHFPADEFQEIQVADMGRSDNPGTGGCTGAGIEVSWSEGKVIRFCQVDQLVEFLKKAA